MRLLFSLRQQLMAQRAAHSAAGDEGKFTGQHVGDEIQLGDVFSHISGGMPESLASISCISHKRVLVVFFLKITENEIRKSKVRRNASLLYEYQLLCVRSAALTENSNAIPERYQTKRTFILISRHWPVLTQIICSTPSKSSTTLHELHDLMTVSVS